MTALLESDHILEQNDTDSSRADRSTADPAPKLARLEPTAVQPGSAVMVRAGLIVLACLIGAFLAQVVLFSRVEEKVHQEISYAKLRNELAGGTAPISGVTPSHHLLTAGVPIAVLQIRRLGLKAVVEAGTSGQVLESGPGWLRNSTFPGQAGVTVIYGRAGSYGSPFGRLDDLHRGDKIVVTTQVAQSTYVVTDRRQASSLQPAALSDGQGRLTLVTVRESALIPSSVFYVDAVSSTLPTGAGPPGVSIPPAERPLGVDTGRLWETLFGLELLLIATIGAVWAWLRWGRAQAWIVSAPVIAFLCYFVTIRTTDLLPNLL